MNVYMEERGPRMTNCTDILSDILFDWIILRADRKIDNKFFGTIYIYSIELNKKYNTRVPTVIRDKYTW